MGMHDGFVLKTPATFGTFEVGNDVINYIVSMSNNNSNNKVNTPQLRVNDNIIVSGESNNIDAIDIELNEHAFNKYVNCIITRYSKYKW